MLPDDVGSHPPSRDQGGGGGGIRVSCLGTLRCRCRVWALWPDLLRGCCVVWLWQVCWPGFDTLHVARLMRNH